MDCRDWYEDSFPMGTHGNLSDYYRVQEERGRSEGGFYIIRVTDRCFKIGITESPNQNIGNRVEDYVNNMRAFTRSGYKSAFSEIQLTYRETNYDKYYTKLNSDEQAAVDENLKNYKPVGSQGRFDWTKDEEGNLILKTSGTVEQRIQQLKEMTPTSKIEKKQTNFLKPLYNRCT